MPFGPGEDRRQTAGSICLVANDLDYLVKNGGIGTYFWLLAHLLAREGWRVQVLYCGPVEDPAAVRTVRRHLGQAGVGFCLLDEFPPHPDFQVPIVDLPPLVQRSDRVRLALEELHRRTPFDLVEFADWQAAGFRTVQAKRASAFWDGVGLIVKLHSPSHWCREGNWQWMTSWDEPQLDHCERFAFEHADFQVSASRYMLDSVRAAGWSVRDDALVAYNPYPAPAAVPDGEAGGGRPEVVFFGRLETRKGLEIFLDAVRHLDPDIPVAFLGKDPHPGPDSPAAALIASRCEGRPFTLLTDRNRESALKYLAGGNRLAVLPSLADNLPFTVIECAVNGIPFLASRVGGTPEIVPSPELHERLLFEPTAKDLSRCLRAYLAAPAEHRRRWSQAARQVTDVAANHRAVAEFYRGCLDQVRSARKTRAEGGVPATPLPPPLVSAVVPYYNLGAYLPDTLRSLAEQTYPNLEVIVIDDGSTDADSVRVFEEQRGKYPGFRFLRFDNAGLPPTRTRGLAEARGEFYLSVDADNVARPYMVERFVEAIRRNPDLAAVTCYMLTFRETADLDRGNYYYAYRPVGGPHLMASWANVYGDANALYRAADLRAIGGFATDRTIVYEDWHTFVRLVNSGRRVGVVPDHLFYYRFRDQALSRVPNPFPHQLPILRQFIRGVHLSPAEQISLWTTVASLNHQLDTMRRQVRESRLVLANLQGSLRYRMADRAAGLLKRLPLAYPLLRALLKGGLVAWKKLPRLHRM